MIKNFTFLKAQLVLFVTLLAFAINYSKAQNMAYVSSEVTSVSPQMVGVNTPEARVALINIVTSGTTNPLTLTNINIGTGNTNIANISNAHVFYTGSSGTFINSVQFGSTIIASTSALVFNGSTTLGSGNNYFWVAYDIPTTAQEDTLHVIVNSMVVSGNLYTPSPNQPSLKRFIKAPISGTYTVGAGGDFELLSTAVSNLNTRGMSGNTDFKIISNITETVAASIVEWQEFGAGNHTLTISPDAPVLRTITSSATTLLLMSGPDRVIIDGRFNGNGKYLALHNTNTSQSICVFFNTSLSNTNGCNNSVVRNCIFYSGTTTHTFAVNVHIGATGHNNILITENECRKGYYGINVGVPVGASQVLANYNGIVITNNQVGGSVPTDFISNNGIRLNNTTGAIVSGNEIRDVQTASAINNAGIDVGINSINAVVSGNKIYNIRNTHPSGYGTSGIALTGGDGHLVYNNLIFGLDAFSFSAGNVRSIYGIRATSGANHQVYHNTISLSGTSMATVANASHGIGFIGATSVDFRNNIIENKQTGPSGFKSYAVYQSAASSISTSNHNNYFVDGANAMLAFLNGSDRATLADVQTAASQDAASFFGDPLFDLNWEPQSCFANNSAMPISTITTDITGVLRAMLPDMGAKEYTPVLPSAPAVASPVLYCEGDAATALTATVANSANWYVAASGGSGNHTAPTPSTATAGTVSYWVSDSISATGCNSLRSKIEVMVGVPTSIAQQPVGNAVCEGEAVEIEVNATGLNLNYEWSLNGTALAGNNSPILSFPASSLADGGNYTVQVTGHCGSPVTSNITALTVYPLPTVVANASAQAICVGEPLTLWGSGADTFVWDGGFPDNTTIYPSITQIYSTIGTDANGCKNTDEILVVVNNLPPVVANSSLTTICKGDQVTLTGSGAATYQWNNGASQGQPIALTETTTFTVFGTDVNSCSNKDSITITVNPLPIVTLDSLGVVCPWHVPFALTGGSPLNGTYYYANNSIVLFDPAAFGVGFHTIVYSFTDNNSCTSKDSSILEVNQCIGVWEYTNYPTTMHVFPNPASDLFSIECISQENEEANIRLISATGQMVFNEKTNLTAGSNIISINSHQFARGLYFVQLQTGKSVVNKKLVLR